MENLYNNAIKAELLIDVINFNKKIIGTRVLKKPECLSDERLDFAVTVLTEEIDEFIQAHGKNDVPAALDAMIDLIYYAFGRIYELGIDPISFANAWDTVHNANMKKQKGNKGRGSDQDAIKPKDWEEPKIESKLNMDIYTEIAHMLGLSRDEAKAFCLAANYSGGREKILAKYGYTRTTPESTFTMVDIPVPFQECAELRKKKGEDYQNGNIQMKDYFPFGLISYTQMLHTKILRLRSLIGENKKPKNESIRDTLLDMMNYACFAIEAIDKKEV